MRVWEDRKIGRRVYGARKVWWRLQRDDIGVARCTVELPMRDLGIAGAAARGKAPRTTIPGPDGPGRPSELDRPRIRGPAHSCAVVRSLR